MRQAQSAPLFVQNGDDTLKHGLDSRRRVRGSDPADPAPRSPLLRRCRAQSLLKCHARSCRVAARRPVCSFPLEYCEFGSSLSKCKDRLKADDPDLYDKYYSDGVFSSYLLSGTTVLITIYRGSAGEARYSKYRGANQAGEGFCEERGKGSGKG